MGHILSERGIGLTGKKVKAVVNAKEPESINEVCNFLGLINFCVQFIRPDLAKTAEPLRYLTQQSLLFS